MVPYFLGTTTAAAAAEAVSQGGEKIPHICNKAPVPPCSWETVFSAAMGVWCLCHRKIMHKVLI